MLSSPAMKGQQYTRTYKKIPLLELKDSIYHCTVIDKNVYLDGDIYLGDTTALNRLQNLPLFAIVTDDNFFHQTRWPNGIVPITFDNNFQLSERNVIINALNEIMAVTNITFKLHRSEPDYIIYKKLTVKELGFKGGSSPVGKIGNEQAIVLSSLSSVVIKHETLHSLGFYHEQSREDRDNFIRIIEANIDRSEPDKLHNFEKHSSFIKLIGTYDFKSIMHYEFNEFGVIEDKKPKQTIERISDPSNKDFGNTTLSDGDINAVNQIYPNRPRERLMLRLFNDIFKDNESWTELPFIGSRRNYFADINGDGKEDAITSNIGTYISVRKSNGNTFGQAETFSYTDYFGKKGTFFADVTGDGKADAIAINITETLVRRSTGAYFSVPETWSNGFLSGTKGTFFADVTGDGKADAIVVEESGVKIYRSNGVSFGQKENWTSIGYFGNRGTFFADVTGDGKADAIVVNDLGVTVRRSTGNTFAPNETWTSNPYYGTAGTFFADVTGDGKADAIVVNDFGVTIRRSTGNAFLPNETGTSNPYLADKGIFFADIKGSGKCAAIVVNNGNIVARPAE